MDNLVLTLKYYRDSSIILLSQHLFALTQVNTALHLPKNRTISQVSDHLVMLFMNLFMDLITSFRELKWFVVCGNW